MEKNDKGMYRSAREQGERVAYWTGIEAGRFGRKDECFTADDQPYRKWGKCSAIGYIDSFIKIFSCVNGLHIKALGRENDTGISFGNGTDVIKTLWILFELLQVEQDESKGDQLFGCADGKGRGEKN